MNSDFYWEYNPWTDVIRAQTEQPRNQLMGYA